MSTAFTSPAILALEVGTLHVRAALFEMIEGKYRSLATTKAFRAQDGGENGESLLEAAWAAVSDAQEVSGKTLLDQHGNLLSRHDVAIGVDHVVCGVSDEPRIAVIGLTSEFSTRAAARAAAEVGTVVDTVSLIQEAQVQPVADAAHPLTDRLLSLLTEARPEVLVLAGGTDGGIRHVVTWCAQALATILRYVAPTPFVIFAGNQDLSASIAPLFADVAELRVVPNVRPTSKTENLEPLRRAIEDAWLDQVYRRLPHVRRFENWLGTAVTPMRQAVRTTLTELARGRGGTMYLVDAGARGVTTAAAQWQGTFGSHRTPTGFSLRFDDIPDLARALVSATPDRNSEAEMRDLLGNWWLRPWAMPKVLDPTFVTAVAREVLRSALQENKAFGLNPENVRPDLIIGRGGFFENTSDQLIAQVIAEVTRPTWPIEVAVDVDGMLCLAGLAETAEPGIVEDIASEDGLRLLGRLDGGRAVSDPGRPRASALVTQPRTSALNIAIPATSSGAPASSPSVRVS